MSRFAKGRPLESLISVPTDAVVATATGVNWERQRNLPPDKELVVILQKAIEELLELIVYILFFMPGSLSLLELADSLAFINKILQEIFKRLQIDLVAETTTTLNEANVFLAQAMLAAPLKSANLTQPTSANSAIDFLENLMGLSGYVANQRINKRGLKEAISRMKDILSEPSSYVWGNFGEPGLNKEVEGQITQLLLGKAFHQPLNGTWNLSNAIDVYSELVIEVQKLAETLFNYPGINLLVASMFAQIVTEGGVRVGGKNVDNYPLLQSPQENNGNGKLPSQNGNDQSTINIKELRGLFPAHMIPAGYQIGGSQTPNEFMQQRYPNFNNSEILELIAQARII